MLGDYPTHRRLVRDLVVESGLVATFPNYTPSPEAHFPVAINQAYAANTTYCVMKAKLMRTTAYSLWLVACSLNLLLIVRVINHTVL